MKKLQRWAFHFESDIEIPVFSILSEAMKKSGTKCKLGNCMLFREEVASTIELHRYKAQIGKLASTILKRMYYGEASSMRLAKSLYQSMRQLKVLD